MNLQTILFLVLLHPFGYMCIRIFLRHSWHVFASSWLIGSALSTSFYFILLTREMSATSAFLLIGTISTSIASFAFLLPDYRMYVRSLKAYVWPEDSNSQPFFIAVLTILFFVVLQNQFWPHTDWDAITLYDFRAKTLVHTNSLSPLLTTTQDLYIVSYPWYTSVLFAFCYLLGSWNPMGIFSFLSISLAITFFSVLKSTRNSFTAHSGVLALLTVPLFFTHMTVAYTNFPFSIFWGLGVVFLLTWIRGESHEVGLLGSILFGFSFWIRASEPFWVIGVFLLCCGVLMRKQPMAVLWLFPMLLAKVLWKLYVGAVLVRILSAQNPDVATFMKPTPVDLYIFFDVERWMAVFAHLWKFALPLWAGWLVCIACIILRLSYVRKNAIALTTVGAIGALIVLGTFVFASTPFWREIVDSFQRLLLFAFPVFVYVVCSAYQSDKSREDS